MHVGLIVDGARRWARRESVPLVEAYAQSLNRVDDLIRELFEHGVTAVSLYLLSRDNLNRSEADLAAVFEATTQFLTTQAPQLVADHGAGFGVAGDLGSVPAGYRDAAESLTTSSPARDADRRVYLLVAYSPAEELAAQWRPGLDTMTELVAALWVPERVDLVVRTGGAALFSDFLPLQAGYARLLVSPLSIADLTWEHISEAVLDVRDSEQLQGR